MLHFPVLQLISAWKNSNRPWVCDICAGDVEGGYTHPSKPLRNDLWNAPSNGEMVTWCHSPHPVDLDDWRFSEMPGNPGACSKKEKRWRNRATQLWKRCMKATRMWHIDQLITLIHILTYDPKTIHQSFFWIFDNSFPLNSLLGCSRAGRFTIQVKVTMFLQALRRGGRIQRIRRYTKHASIEAN